MQPLAEKADKLHDDLRDALTRIHYDELMAKKVELDRQSTDPSFWQDTALAQKVTKEQAALGKRLGPWTELSHLLTDMRELIATGDDSLKADLEQQIETIETKFMVLKEELKFAGPYDYHNVFLTLHAGAGGSDAQDWTAMLLRMYVRWAEQNDMTVEMVEEAAGEEAGLKRAMLKISGSAAYGKLKGEHGVHRLVRLSPFNAESRETSFAKVEVVPEIDEPEAVVIDEKDLKIDVYRSGGHGGQSVNTTDSAVRVTHLPTGIVVAIQNERSQLQNKETALTIVRSRLAQLQLEQHTERLSDLKGPNEQAAWGNQIRSYVLHPYKQVKDLRTGCTSSDPDDILNGNLNPFIMAYLEHTLGSG